MKFLPLLTLFGLTMATAIPSDSNEEECDCPVNGNLPAEGSYVSASAFYEISAKKPNKHYAPSLHAKITPNDLCFITNLVLPPSAAGKTCTLKFLFPTKKQAKQRYSFSGPGHFTFTGYATGVGADDTTTYNHQPAPGPSKCSLFSRTRTLFFDSGLDAAVDSHADFVSFLPRRPAQPSRGPARQRVHHLLWSLRRAGPVQVDDGQR